METENQPANPAKGGKTVPEKDLIAVKMREKALKDELAGYKSRLAETEAELEARATNMDDDDEVRKVREHLISENKKLANERASLDKDKASLSEERKEARVKTLASEYGVELDDIKDAEDPEKEALRLVNERLTKEKADQATKTPESVYESSGGGAVKTNIKDMSDEEFMKYSDAKIQEASLKR